MLSSSWNATRFPQKPLAQPSYSFSHVPAAKSNLEHSSLQYVDNRDAFHACMAEMLLLCKEATRRRRHTTCPGTTTTTTASKPLSLEYLADRIDVDDPIFGFVVRTNERIDAATETNLTTPPSKEEEEYSSKRLQSSSQPPTNDFWQRGMLQGFITCTTFTNYQKSFEWDSLNPAAFEYDHENTEPLEGEFNSCRIRDDGSLSLEMQNTVRCGDVWNEGIVWPRIAEISLLGGLKCGRVLLSLMIEHLECMKASERCNYDYVVLQATDNSISFYESMGFARVGAVVKEERDAFSSAGDTTGYDSVDVTAGAVSHSNIAETSSADARSPNFVCGPTIPYHVGKGGDTPTDIARKSDVDVWDIIFLNKEIYPEISPRSRLMVGTVLHIPATKQSKLKSSLRAKTRRTPQWYICNENDTPRMIAKIFNVACVDFVEANKRRLEGLLSNSRLKEGTRVQVSDFDLTGESEFKPYAHWSFPDDQFEEPEPSYMMARRLKRRKGNAATPREFEMSLAVPVTQYEPPCLLLPISPGPVTQSDGNENKAELIHGGFAVLSRRTTAVSSRRKFVQSSQQNLFPDALTPPKKPPSAYQLFGVEKREAHRDELHGLHASEIAKFVGNLWSSMSAFRKTKYEKKEETLRQAYLRDKEAYEADVMACVTSSGTGESISDFNNSTITTASSNLNNTAPRRSSDSSVLSLFNKVVKLKPGALTEGSEYTYWYVLTFIPDLRWCHLAPLIQVGTFGAERIKVQGRPKYKLVDESLGKEVDISSSFCIPINSRSMKRTLDADKEEWDIIDDGSPADGGNVSFRAKHRNGTRMMMMNGKSSEVPSRFTTCDRLPSLTALLNNHDVSVKIIYGMCISDKSTPMKSPGERQQRHSLIGDSPASLFSFSPLTECVEPLRKKRGRPKGSKNKPKTLPQSAPNPTGSHCEQLEDTHLRYAQSSFGHQTSLPLIACNNSSSPCSAVSRSQPPIYTRSSPGRAALLSLGQHHLQLLHSPLVRVRAPRSVFPANVRFSPLSLSPHTSQDQINHGQPLITSAHLLTKKHPTLKSALVGTSESDPNACNFYIEASPNVQSSQSSKRLGRSADISKSRLSSSGRKRSSSKFLDSRWNGYFTLLQEFHRLHGNCRVPRVFPNNQAFSNWVHNQRYCKTLSLQRISLLKSLDFDWSPLAFQVDTVAISEVETEAVNMYSNCVDPDLAAASRLLSCFTSDPVESSTNSLSIPLETTSEEPMMLSTAPSPSGAGDQSLPVVDLPSRDLSNDKSQFTLALESKLSKHDDSSSVECPAFCSLPESSSSPQSSSVVTSGTPPRKIVHSSLRSTFALSVEEDPSKLILECSTASTDLVVKAHSELKHDATNTSSETTIDNKCVARSLMTPPVIGLASTRRSKRSKSDKVSPPQPCAIGLSDVAESEPVIQSSPPTHRGRTSTDASTNIVQTEITVIRRLRKATSRVAVKESYSEDEVSVHSSDRTCSTRRVQGSSPFVGRSIQYRKGRHVSHRNEVPDPLLSSQQQSGTNFEYNRRLRSLHNENYDPPKGNEKVFSAVKILSPRLKTGSEKIPRELIALLPDYRPRKRRHASSSESRRFV